MDSVSAKKADTSICLSVPDPSWQVRLLDRLRKRFVLAKASKCRWCGKVLLDRQERISGACSSECAELEDFALSCGV